jgi:putative phosphoesterase
MLQNQYIGCGYEAPEFDLFYQAMSMQLPECDVIVFGHFHAPVVREWRGILFVNPGSIAPPHSRPTYAVLELGDKVTARLHLLA